MSTQTFTTDVFSVDTILDWQTFNQEKASARSSALDSVGLDATAGPDFQAADGGVAAADATPVIIPGVAGLILGTEGADTIDGTTGVDVILAFGGNDTINGGGGDDIISGGSGDDLIYGDGQLYGDDGNDDIHGGDDAFIVDYLYGGAGNDVLHGGQGNDGLNGGAGDDILYADPASSDPSNPINGYGDAFIFGNGWGHDQVMDFEDGIDVFDMSQVIGLLGYSQLTVAASGDDTLISYGNDTILVVGVESTAIDAGDFQFLV
ncbi:calcium-binding protein [Chelatococcus sp. GCM10030263]|uniref:calcium-binding protein n=1 Tax=Chelatococcus sp. GCM10030263 TaxID=3273387 RepID=UPI003611DF0C